MGGWGLIVVARVKPLLVMTRPRAAAERFVSALAEPVRAELQVVIAPLVEIAPTGLEPDLSDARGVILTSANGVSHAPEGQGLPAYCVGPRTAEAARARGWHVIRTEPNAAELLKVLQAEPIPGPLVHLCGRHRRGEIAATLSAAGIPVTEQVLYDQPLQPPSARMLRAFAGEVPVILPLFSPRTAAHLAAQITSALGTNVLAMSEAVAAPLAGVRFAQVMVVPKPTGDEMARGIELWLKRISLP